MTSIDIRLLPLNVHLGRHVEHDERSKAYAFLERDTKPVSVTWQSNIDVLDQGQLGSCTGNAAVGCLGFDPYWVSLAAAKNRRTLDETLAVKVYAEATTLDSIPGTYPPSDTGSSGLAAAKALSQLGLISGYRHAMSLNSALVALQHGPVICGTNWYNNMFNPDSNGLVSIPLGDTLAGGHEYVMYGVDVEKELCLFRNSWGTGWGQQGDFTMTVDTFNRLLLENGDVTVFTPLTAPAPAPLPAPGAVDPDTLAAYRALKDWAAKNGVA